MNIILGYEDLVDIFGGSSQNCFDQTCNRNRRLLIQCLIKDNCLVCKIWEVSAEVSTGWGGGGT